MSHKIHPTAIVSPEAEIGEDVEIGPFCRVEERVFIGDGCILQSGVLIDRGTILGKRNFIAHGAVLGTPPQDMKYDQSAKSQLVVGDDNAFREYCTVNRATGDGEKTVIGSRCMLMATSHVGHNCILGDEVILSNVATLAGHVEIQDWAILGGVVAIPQFTRMGKGSYLGGFSAIRQDLPPFYRAAGNPGAPVGINRIGMERRGFSKETINAVHRCYKILYMCGLKMDDAIERMKDESGELEEIRLTIDFLNTTRNGIARPRPLR